jgi:peptide chain release factor 3
VLLFKNEWNVNQLLPDHPSLKLSAIAPVTIGNSAVS